MTINLFSGFSIFRTNHPKLSVTVPVTKEESALFNTATFAKYIGTPALSFTTDENI